MNNLDANGPSTASATSMLTPEFMNQLAQPSVRRVVLVGCGGGFDFVHSMLLYPELKRMGKEIVVVSNSFGYVEWFDALPLPEEVNAIPPMDVRSVTAATGHARPNEYAPELHVLSFLDKTYPRDAPHSMFACNARKMVAPAFSRFLERLQADAIVAIDGGSDSLMRGDEEGLGDPLEDAVTVCSVQKTSARVKLLLSVGLGCDRYNHVSDASSLRAIAELTRAGGFRGSLSAHGPCFDFYRSCLAHVNERQTFRSVLAGSIVAAGEGFFGSGNDGARAIGTPRVRAGDCFLWPLMPMLWAFDVDAVAKRSLLVQWVRDASTVQDQIQNYCQGRKALSVRGVENLPRHVDFRSPCPF